MESYGSLLKQTRLAKNLDLDTVERETSIIRPYLEGLENEDNNAFPGEAYLTGFLKNYAEYLGLDPNQAMILYKNKTLQESPIPEELLAKKDKKSYIPLIVGISSGAVVLILLILFLIFKNQWFPKKAEALEVVETTKNYNLTEKIFTRRVYKGDKIIYPDEKGEIILTVNETVGSFGLLTPVGNLYTELSEESELDINGDKTPDLVVYVSDLSMTDEKRGAEIKLIKRNGTTSSSVSIKEIPYVTDLPASAKKTIIHEDNRAYPFTLKGTFRGSCVFRYKVDRHDSNESYYNNGEVITMTASNGIRLWMSNGNTVKLSITADTNTFNLDFGRAGQVIAEDIKWIKDSDGKYKLVVIELE